MQPSPESLHVFESLQRDSVVRVMPRPSHQDTASSAYLLYCAGAFERTCCAEAQSFWTFSRSSLPTEPHDEASFDFLTPSSRLTVSSPLPQAPATTAAFLLEIDPEYFPPNSVGWKRAVSIRRRAGVSLTSQLSTGWDSLEPRAR